jgi:hypothetical protein
MAVRQSRDVSAQAKILPPERPALAQSSWPAHEIPLQTQITPQDGEFGMTWKRT